VVINANLQLSVVFEEEMLNRGFFILILDEPGNSAAFPIELKTFKKVFLQEIKGKKECLIVCNIGTKD
jgi:hypothetical protein